MREVLGSILSGHLQPLFFINLVEKNSLITKKFLSDAKMATMVYGWVKCGVSTIQFYSRNIT